MKNQNDTKNRYLQSVFTSENFRWVFALMPVLFDEAETLCNEISYQLPSETELGEFQNQIVIPELTIQEKKGDTEIIEFFTNLQQSSKIHVREPDNHENATVALCVGDKF